MHHSQGAVEYKAKVKLHGTNAAVQIHHDGTVVAQSRERLLVDGADNDGFAKWADSIKEQLQHLKGLCVFGEWCGKGIQSGVAVSQLKDKIFAVFAIVNMDTDTFVADPTTIAMAIGDIPNVYVLPWCEPSITVDWKAEATSLEPITALINKHVEQIEACDPWIEATFGVKGTGEGLVFYPTPALKAGSLKMFENLCFKAKGEKHRVVKSKSAATVNPETAANTEEFVKVVLTEARLKQGATAASPEFDKKKTGVFVNWILADVQKETKVELEASGLQWKDVQAPLTAYARKWFLEKS